MAAAGGTDDSRARDKWVGRGWRTRLKNSSTYCTDNENGCVKTAPWKRDRARHTFELATTNMQTQGHTGPTTVRDRNETYSLVGATGVIVKVNQNRAVILSLFLCVCVGIYTPYRRDYSASVSLSPSVLNRLVFLFSFVFFFSSCHLRWSPSFGEWKKQEK